MAWMAGVSISVQYRAASPRVARQGAKDTKERKEDKPPLGVSLRPWRLGAQLLFQSMILLSGYSTMPRAPAALSFGTSVRTTLSSRIVLTATHSGFDSDDTVGFCSAGRIARIAFSRPT